MNFTSQTKKLKDLKTDALIIFLPQDRITAEEKELDKFLAGQIIKLRTAKDFTGEAAKVRLLFTSSHLPRVLLVGLGKNAGLNLEKMREAVGAAALNLKTLPVTTATFVLPRIPRANARETAQALSEAVILASYEFPYYKTGQKNKPKFEDVEVLVSSRDKRATDTGLTTGLVLANAVITTRDLGNHPANYATPEHLAKHARAIGKQFSQIKVKILHRPDIVREKMGALLAVSQGSDI